MEGLRPRQLRQTNSLHSVSTSVCGTDIGCFLLTSCSIFHRCFTAAKLQTSVLTTPCCVSTSVWATDPGCLSLTHCFIPQWHLSHRSSGFSAINCRCFQTKHDLLLTITEHFLGLNLIMPSPRHCFVKFPTYPFQIMYKCNVSVVCSNVKCQHLIWQLV